MMTFYEVIICRNDIKIGRLYVARQEKEILIIDIAPLPNCRGQGVGGYLLKKIMAEAGSAGKSVSLHVEKFNPALALYERLGFQKIGDTDVHYKLEWEQSESPA